MEAPKEKWRKRGGGILFAGSMNGSEDREDGSEAKPKKGSVRIVVCRDKK